MTNKNEAAVGVLVLAGLLDPVGDMGTQGHYDLLPIPWTKIEFEKRVVHTIRADMDIRSRIEYQANIFPFDVNDMQALSRGIGLKTWIRLKDQSPATMKLLTCGVTIARFKSAAVELNQLSYHVPPTIFPWPNDDNNDKLIARLNQLLLGQL